VIRSSSQTSPKGAGCNAWGKTEAAAIREAHDAIAAWIKAAKSMKRAHGVDLLGHALFQAATASASAKGPGFPGPLIACHHRRRLMLFKFETPSCSSLCGC